MSVISRLFESVCVCVTVHRSGMYVQIMRCYCSNLNTVTTLKTRLRNLLLHSLIFEPASPPPPAVQFLSGGGSYDSCPTFPYTYLRLVAAQYHPPMLFQRNLNILENILHIYFPNSQRPFS